MSTTSPAVKIGRPTLLIPLVLFLAVIADRAQIGVSTGGRGALPLLVFLAPLGALAALVRYGVHRTLGFLSSPTFIVGVLPYVALSGVLPILGVMFNVYPERTLLSVTAMTSALSLLAIGAALSDRDQSDWTPWLMAAIIAQFLYALAQAIYLAKGPAWELFQPLHDWDLSLQLLNGTLVQARSSGLYFNPNELGLWAGIAVIAGWAMLPTKLRVVGVTLAVLTLVFSESRGATVALVVAVMAAAILSIIDRRVSVGRIAKTIATILIGGVFVGSVAVLVGLPAAFLERFGSLLNVFTQGPTADANLAGRLDYWSAVTSLNVIYPWGTWGPPELLLGSAVDSSWFQAFAQGSVPYAGSLGLLLISASTLRRSRHRHLLRVLAVFIAMTGLTQTPFGYPATILFWVLLGSALQESLVERGSEPQPESRRSDTATTRPAAVR